MTIYNRVYKVLHVVDIMYYNFSSHHAFYLFAKVTPVFERGI